MSLMRPDPTFYPSPGMAMQAPPEQLAYVVLLNVGKNGKKDALGVIDLDPKSSGYGRLGVFGSIHPCGELVFFKQPLREAVDQPL